MMVTCIIPSTLSKFLQKPLIKCIDSLFTSSKLVKVKIHVFIVTSNTSGNLILARKQIRLIQTKERVGFSEINNLAINETINTYPSDYYLLINDDAWVDDNFFRNLLFKKQYLAADLVVPLIYESDGIVIDSFGAEYFNSGYAKKNVSLGVKTTLAPASCLLIKTNFLKELKNKYGYIFNPILNFYHEDVDLSIRALVIGAKILKVKEMIAYHLGSATAGKKSYFVMYHSYRNIIWVIMMNWPIKILVSNFPNIFLVQVWSFLYSSLKFGPRLYIRVFLDTLKNLNKIFSYRKKNLNVLSTKFNFSKVLSEYTFKTRYGWKIKFL